MVTTTVSPEQRKAQLDGVVARYEAKGYHVEDRSEFRVTMMRPKEFSFIWALLWFLLFGVGILVYLFYYMGKSDKRVTLEVEEFGRLTEQEIK